jgi:Family of unknown function (DUF6502)
MDDTAKGSAPGVREGPLLAAVRRLLRPLVRILVSRSIPYPAAAELLRWLYVDVAVRQFPLDDKPQTDSRISLLTAVHRREVKRLRRQKDPGFRAPSAASLGSRLVAQWTTRPEYLDASGTPRALPYVSGDARRPSFENLVRSVSRDIRPRVVLDEWLRLGVARVDDAEQIHLVVEAFVPAKGNDELAYYFGRNIHDHLAACAHNVLGEGEAFFERGVHYNHLTRESVDEIDTLAKEEGMRVLKKVNARALELQQQDSGREGATLRMNLGVYFFAEDAAQSDVEAKPEEPGEADA